jgi:hypothetical protein
MSACPKCIVVFCVLRAQVAFIGSYGNYHPVDRDIGHDNELHEDIKNSSLFTHTLHFMGKLCGIR